MADTTGKAEKRGRQKNSPLSGDKLLTITQRYEKNPKGTPPEPDLITIIPESKDIAEWQQNLNELDIQKEMSVCGYLEAMKFFQAQQVTPAPQAKPVKEIQPAPEPKIKQQEDMFYPAFGLYQSPFRLSDQGSERTELEAELGFSFKPIPTSAYMEVLIKTVTGADTLFLGERGLGKSTIGELLKEDLTKKGKPIYTVIAPKTFIQFYQNLWQEFLKGIDFNFVSKKEANESIRHSMERNNYLSNPIFVQRDEKGIPVSSFPMVCSHPACPHKPKCALTETDNNHTMDFLYLPLYNFPKDINCPLFRWLIVKIADLYEIKGTLFLDAPDDLIKHNNIEYFTALIAELRINKNLIIMITREQYEKMRKSEYFTRWQFQELKRMTQGELKQVLLSRIETVRDNSKEYPNLFCEETLTYIVNQANGNPRKAIQYSERVLEIMLAQDSKTGANLEFTLNALEGRLPTTLTLGDALENIVREYREKKAGWVRGSEINRKLVEEYNLVNINPASLGRKLKNMHVENRYTPYAEYYFN
jgi:hypothetical protein